jgi:hypothetical protein
MQVRVSVLDTLNSFLQYCELAITDFDVLRVVEGYARQSSIRTRSLATVFFKILH